MFNFSFKVFKSAEDREKFEAYEADPEAVDHKRPPYYYGSAYGETRTESVRKVATALGVTHRSLLLDGANEEEPKDE